MLAAKGIHTSLHRICAGRYVYRCPCLLPSYLGSTEPLLASSRLKSSFPALSTDQDASVLSSSGANSAASAAAPLCEAISSSLSTWRHSQQTARCASSVACSEAVRSPAV